MLKLLLVLAVLPSSNGAMRPLQQRRWKPIGTTSTGNPVFIDPKSVKVKDGITTATMRTVYTKPVDTPKGPITSVRSIAMFKCAEGTVAAKETTMFLDEKAGKIFDRSVPGIPGYAKPFESTYADVAMKYLCAKR